MNTIKPTIGFWDADCPIHNGEFGHCQITQTKCPKVTELDNGDYEFDYPVNCPAKIGIIIKI